MKIIKKGKYTDKVYKCENKKCQCEFEIDYDDIEFEWIDAILYSKIKAIIKCPECGHRIYLQKYENEVENDNSNNN